VRSFDLSFRPVRQRCRVRIGSGALDELVDELGGEWPRRLLAVVSDSNVGPLHGAPLAARLRKRGLRVETLTFPAGEASKNRETAARLEDRLYEIGAGRDSVVIAVGGGVTGDLSGLLASLWHRGVPVVQVPTSLLAMVDASIGGKTGVNLSAAKNLIGTVHQPWGVYADVALLETLPEAEYVAGFGEVVKSAAIADIRFLRWLESAAPALLSRDASAVEQAVVRCVEIKGRVVTRDERESGRRAMLNFGHTLGHALEAVSGYRVAHGEAVAAGICLEARLAAKVTGFPPAHVRRLVSLVAAFGLPPCLPVGSSIAELIDATRRDKKVRDRRVRYALPVALGRMPSGEEWTVAVEDDVVRGVLEESAREQP